VACVDRVSVDRRSVDRRLLEAEGAQEADAALGGRDLAGEGGGGDGQLAVPRLGRVRLDVLDHLCWDDRETVSGKRAGAPGCGFDGRREAP
jgi:hypothetical protein